MVWVYAEGNPFSNSTGSVSSMVEWVYKCLLEFPALKSSEASQFDAQSDCGLRDIMVSTDPPYYDNIGYADLSDFFYVWMRQSLRKAYPNLFGTMLVPKAEELVATPCRFEGSVEKARCACGPARSCRSGLRRWSTGCSPWPSAGAGRMRRLPATLSSWPERPGARPPGRRRLWGAGGLLGYCQLPAAVRPQVERSVPEEAVAGLPHLGQGTDGRPQQAGPSGRAGFQRQRHLALYHMFRARVPVDRLPNIKPVLQRAGVSALPRANVAVLVGAAGRMESIWKPAAANEGFEVVRRRLFLDCRDPGARDAVCARFSQMYNENQSGFPVEARELEYRDRMISCCPIHPEVFDRLHPDGCAGSAG